MHAERDINVPSLSVCLSDAHVVTVFDDLVGHHSSFLSPSADTKGNLSPKR